MNKERRKKLQEAIDRLEEASGIVEDVTMEEQTAFDSLPESIQYSERGERMETIISDLEEAVSLIDDATQLLVDSSS